MQTSFLEPPIDRFQGETRWLSNFEVADVVMYGITYTTNEHAYQALKANNLPERLHVASAGTPGLAKKRGQKINMRKDWERVKLGVMYDINLDKFTRHAYLREKLIATKGRELIEGNDWGDRFWGFSKGKGQNHLGRILMRVRFFLINGDMHGPPMYGPPVVNSDHG